MKSFLVIGKKPIIKWGLLPDKTYYQGEIPDGYSLAVNPSKGVIVVDVDRHGDKDGFVNIPEHLKKELDATFHYPTKGDGMHYWFTYTGVQDLANRASEFSIDLRTHKGYVIWNSEYDLSILSRDVIGHTSPEMNDWLEKLFAFKRGG